MATAAALKAESRSGLGTTKSRQLRRQGLVPASIYGLGKAPESVAVPVDALNPIVQSGAHVVDVSLGDQVEKVIVREIQFDTFMTSILHVDFQRIDPNATVEVEVALELRGILNEGVLDQPLHSVTVSCLPWLVPDKFSVRIGALKIGDRITISNLELPEGVTIDLPADTVILRITEAQDVEIVHEDILAAAEPELIGRKADAEDSE